MAGLFEKLYAGARKTGALVDTMTVRVNLIDDEGKKVAMSAKTEGLAMVEDTPAGFASALDTAEKVGVNRSSKFAKSTGSRRFSVNGKFAGEFYLAHEMGEELPGQDA